MKRRRLSLEERAQLREERARRRRELLDQAGLRRRDIAQVGRDIAAFAFGPDDEPRMERLDAQVARLDASLAASQLARLLVESDDPKKAERLIEELQEAVGRWKRSSEGWWEARIVWRPRLLITQDPETKKVVAMAVLRPFGPYYYRHWRQEGRQHTQYLGREMPEDFPSDQEVPEVPGDQAIMPASALSREAVVLADRLLDLHNAELDKQRRDRLYRVLKVASRRAERRLRHDTQAGLELCVLDTLLHTTDPELGVSSSALLQVKVSPPPQVRLPLDDA